MKLSKENTITLLWVSLFAVAMGYLESAVVVYIREIYYPEGFCFPMKLISPQILITEFWREVATMVMLLGVALIAGRTAIAPFAYFVLAFGIWDIFYYVFLKILLNWPESLMTWDILFFIPTTWVGPVFAPVINSVTMIVLALVIILRKEIAHHVKTNWPIWLLMILGSLLIIVAYTYEYSCFMLQRYSLKQLFTASSSSEVLTFAVSYMPVKFPWLTFLSGEAMHLAAIFILIKDNFKKPANNML